MLLVVGVASHPDTVVGNVVSVLDGCGALSPLEVKHVVGHVIPVLANVLRVVELFVDSAWLVYELGARRPRGGESPRALRRVEQEFLDALAGVETLDVAAAVFRNPVDAACALSKLKIEKVTREDGGQICTAVFDTFDELLSI